MIHFTRPCAFYPASPEQYSTIARGPLSLVARKLPFIVLIVQLLMRVVLESLRYIDCRRYVWQFHLLQYTSPLNFTINIITITTPTSISTYIPISP